jgi:hypothetical protein
VAPIPAEAQRVAAAGSRCPVKISRKPRAFAGRGAEAACRRRGRPPCAGTAPPVGWAWASAGTSALQRCMTRASSPEIGFDARHISVPGGGVTTGQVCHRQ